MIRFIYLFTLILFTGSFLSGLKIPETPSGYVNDYANLLSSQEKNSLEAKCRLIEDKTTAQIVIAIFKSLEGENLENFSIRLAEKWKIGQKGKDNGLIILCFLNERKIRIEVGYGLEHIITDIYASRIIRDVMAPEFRVNNYYGGFSKALDVIKKLLYIEYKIEDGSNETNSSFQNGDSQDYSSLIKYILILLGIFLLIDMLRYNSYKLENRYNKYRYDFWEWFFIFSITFIILKLLFQMAAYSGGGSDRSIGSGRSFRGGGGKFGGGGASGGW